MSAFLTEYIMPGRIKRGLRSAEVHKLHQGEPI